MDTVGVHCFNDARECWVRVEAVRDKPVVEAGASLVVDVVVVLLLLLVMLLRRPRFRFFSSLSNERLVRREESEKVRLSRVQLSRAPKTHSVRVYTSQQKL